MEDAMGVSSVLLLSIIALWVSVTPELRSNPVTTSLGLLALGGVAALTYGKWLDIRAKQAHLELDRRH
jgi:hypothetical protein